MDAWPDEPRIEEVLRARPSRPANPEIENRVLTELAEAVTSSDGNVLQRLVERALVLCNAGSAGVSLIEFDGPDKVFRWHAVAGRWSKYLMGSMPRDASPCGVVVDRHSPQLMPHPEQYFPAMRAAEPLATEALLVPFNVLGETVGTVWVVLHDERTSFTAEDLRVVKSLAHFASVAYLIRTTLSHSLEVKDELTRANERLKRENARLSQKLDQVSG